MASTSRAVNCSSSKRKMDGKKQESVLELSDVTCPICMEIRIEPVTMPCNHELCLSCFEQHVQKASLRCPLCRRYISNWARKASRQGSLVNQQRWRTIQQYFPERVHKRLNDIDDDDDMDVGKPSSNQDDGNGFPRPLISDQGEIRKEFESQLNKLMEEEEKQRQIENAKSERLIRMLTQMDERDAEKKRLQGLRLTQDDSAFARALSDEINENSSTDLYVLNSEFRDLHGQTPRAESVPILDALPSKSRKRNRPFLSTGFAAPPGAARTTRAASQSVHSSAALGGLRDSATPPFRRNSSSASLPLCLEKFSVDEPLIVIEDFGADDEPCPFGTSSRVLPCPSRNIANNSVPCEDSEEDSISGELCHFTPIKVEPKTPPMRSPDGRLFEPALIHTKPRNLSGDIEEHQRATAPVLHNRIALVAEQRAAALGGGDGGGYLESASIVVPVPNIGGPSSALSRRLVAFPLTPTNVTLKVFANQKGRNDSPNTPTLRNDLPCIVDAANKENPVGKLASFDKPTAGVKRRKLRQCDSPSPTKRQKSRRMSLAAAQTPATRERHNPPSKTKPAGGLQRAPGRSKVLSKAGIIDESSTNGKRVSTYMPHAGERHAVAATKSVVSRGRSRGSATVVSTDDSHKTTRRLSAKRQLESDHLLALRLSKEWEREGRLVDRRAGTDGQYLLRQRRVVQ